jgi:hypothetical protein
MPNFLLIVSCIAVALMVGGGIYEGLVIVPQFKSDPPRSFRIFQKYTDVPLQRFWIPVHTFITLALAAAVLANWKFPVRRMFVLIALSSYVLMRAWSGIYFIREMLRFQKVPLESESSAELLHRVKRWTTLTWFREPLDFITLTCLLVALSLPGLFGCT